MLRRTVAITGGIGSGKTVVSRMFSNFKIPVIDFDVIAKDIIFSNFFFNHVQYAFKNDIYMINEEFFDRKFLRNVFIGNVRVQKFFESFIHPMVYRIAILNWRSLIRHHPYVILVIPLLFEKKLEKFFDRILIIDSFAEVQIERVIKRDDMSQYEAEWFIFNQIRRRDRTKKKYIENVDIIENNSVNDEITLMNQVLEKHVQYLNMMNDRYKIKLEEYF
ncbi:dephospho-CoA kinase [Candidatus Riesia pediculischaeffi]|uniref:Dephospho-CoA kinase n=1 Tax=Candidatus Riesia pediculischaeffi PTSU TaxID=1401651 RepID=A0A0C1RZL0_9ENTR|nr:dephospho-CoA kinase [Candidatus Riesia pediculischaeffi]KIE63727.1 Dephospho-CoA kinase [Candidatus Riesia pediculischaeffi PTSU]